MALQITLAAARVNAGLRQIDVAKALDVSKSVVINWERGVTQPSIGQFQKLCDLYGVAPDDLKIWQRKVVKANR